MNKLFEGISRDPTNANIGWINDRSPLYSEGYKIAARELTQDYGNRLTTEKDTLAFPIIFLYRQYIELTLKDLIRELDNELGHTRDDKILTFHKLLPLWDEAIQLYEKFIKSNGITLIFTSGLKSEKSRLIVNQFNEIDENSFSFRYATDKEGNKNLEELNYISVDNFKFQVELVVTYIENMIETICHAKT